MVKLKHGEARPEAAKQEPRKPPMLTYKVELGGSPCKIRTRLTPEDIRRIPPLAFHGMRARSLAYFDSGERWFQGYAMHVEFHKLGTIGVGPFLDNFLGSTGYSISGVHHDGISVCLGVAMNRASAGFVDTGFTSLDSGDFPAVLIAGVCAPMNYFDVEKKDVVAIARLSKREMEAILRKTQKYPEGTYRWELSRESAFRRLGLVELAQKVVDELGRIAFGAEAAKD